MKRRIRTISVALAFGILWGCGGSPKTESSGSNTAGKRNGSSDDGGATNQGGNSADGATGPASGGSNIPDIDLTSGGSQSNCPSSCEALNANCGMVTDVRCAGVVDCGTCAEDEMCGSVTPNQCTKIKPPCTPKTCEELGATCGAINDGCNDTLLLDCGACPVGQLCGVVTPNRCDVGAVCVPMTCADLPGVECGFQGDGCGASIDCGSCPAGDLCVKEGDLTHCVTPVPDCTPKTCAELGVDCGMTGDGCNNTLDCGNPCVAPKICGGDPTAPGKCGCTGLCSQIPNCEAGTTTSIRGTVYDPGGRNPLYNALVYIPNNPSDPGLQPFTIRTSTCDVCGSTAAGDPLVSTKTGTDGTFTLTDVPVGQGLTLVVQLGRWRRIYTIDIPTPCADNPLPDDGKLTLPKNKSEGDIPLIAAVTGSRDGMECVLWKAGIDTEEFTNPSGDGRVHLYQGSGQDGAGTSIDEATPSETELFAPDADGNVPLNSYDMLILACQGSDNDLDETLQPSLAYWQQLVDYVDNGGRTFATHWSYSYMRAGGAANPLSTTATWMEDERQNTSTGTIVTDPQINPMAADFTAWLGLVGGLDTPVTDPATFPLVDARFNVSAVTPPGQTWVTAPRPPILGDDEPDPTLPEPGQPLPVHYTFNTPVSDGTGDSCGKFVYSDFHVSEGNPRLNFPENCGSWDDFTAQEKVLEFMLFDLSACVTPYIPECEPTTCEVLGYECGISGDGCGNSIDCGPCPVGEICGLITANMCDPFTCTPTTCEALGYECGLAGDGCGNAIDCGPCPPGEVCGAGGPGICGTDTCDPIDCAVQGIECGLAGDGCGNAIDCGPCPPGLICGAGGPGKCGIPSCIPLTCEQQDIPCGKAGDGCGAEIDCGSCEME